MIAVALLTGQIVIRFFFSSSILHHKLTCKAFFLQNALGFVDLQNQYPFSVIHKKVAHRNLLGMFPKAILCLIQLNECSHNE